MATWTKKDYQFFAEVINNTPMSSETRDFLYVEFSHRFRADNANYSWERFYDAVYKGERKGFVPSKYGGWHKKTYDMTADILGRIADEQTRIALISAFGAAFERDNPNFNWDRFRSAANSPFASIQEDSYTIGRYGWDKPLRRPAEVHVRSYRRRA